MGDINENFSETETSQITQNINQGITQGEINSSTTADDVLDVRLTKTQLETLHKILGTPTTHGSLATQGTEIGEDDWHC
ncbi:hypothetical protein V6Z12_D10G133000 [Gossypium hirsutum]